MTIAISKNKRSQLLFRRVEPDIVFSGEISLAEALITVTISEADIEMIDSSMSCTVLPDSDIETPDELIVNVCESGDV